MKTSRCPCGAEFAARHRRAKYCSPACRKHARNLARAEAMADPEYRRKINARGAAWMRAARADPIYRAAHAKPRRPEPTPEETAERERQKKQRQRDYRERPEVKKRRREQAAARRRLPGAALVRIKKQRIYLAAQQARREQAHEQSTGGSI